MRVEAKNSGKKISTKMDIRDTITARKVNNKAIKGSKMVTKGMTTIKTNKDDNGKKIEPRMAWNIRLAEPSELSLGMLFAHNTRKLLCETL